MTNYLIRRFFQMFLVLILSSAAVYYLLTLASPQGPLAGLKLATGKERISQGDVEDMMRMLGLDKPAWLRYVTWLLGDDWLFGGLEKWRSDAKGVVRLDWGTSWTVARGQDVTFLIGSRLGNTIKLMTTSAFVALAVAIPVGIYSAVKQYSKLDYVVTTFTFFGIAMPVFWFGLLMIILFAYYFKEWGLPYLPTGDVESLRNPQQGSVLALLNASPRGLVDQLVHLILPATVLSLLHMASWSRFMRSSMLEVLRQDYVRTARAKGLIERVVITKHALRNALIPIITIVVYQIPGIFGGAIMTETIFNWKGMGLLYFQALNGNDWPVVMALLLITAFLVVVATLLADVLYTVVDPRIRYS